MNITKLTEAVAKAIEFTRQDGIIGYNNNNHMVVDGEEFGTMTWYSEGDHSPDLDTYKWVPPVGYTVRFLGEERHSHKSYYHVAGNGNEFIITDNADYSPADVFDKLEIIDAEDVPTFILRKLA